MNQLRIIAFTHKNIDLTTLGKLVISADQLQTFLPEIKSKFNWAELFVISTCNRVEFVFSSEFTADKNLVKVLIENFPVKLTESEIELFLNQSEIYQEQAALEHLLRVSCSLESMVVGEKEILAQVRKDYDTAKALGLTGDLLRLVMNRLVKTAKEVYTHTNISKKPISVVSIAYRKLKSLNFPKNTRFLIIGSGVTNQHFSKYLKKHGFSNFSIFNRTLENAQKLATDLNAKAYLLSDLDTYENGFDVIITCTGATVPIIHQTLFNKLVNNEESKKLIIDLAVPNDTAEEVKNSEILTYVNIESLQQIAEQNKAERYNELTAAQAIIQQNIEEFKPILKQRKVELAMRQVPEQIKEIRQVATNQVFAKELNELDANSRELLEKVLNYVEKKYIKVPMVLAKDILVKEV